MKMIVKKRQDVLNCQIFPIFEFFVSKVNLTTPQILISRFSLIGFIRLVPPFPSTPISSPPFLLTHPPPFSPPPIHQHTKPPTHPLSNHPNQPTLDTGPFFARRISGDAGKCQDRIGQDRRVRRGKGKRSERCWRWSGWKWRYECR